MTQSSVPAVIGLRYKLSIEEHMTYENPPALEHDRPEARYRLDKGELVCSLKTPANDIRSAREAVEPFIDSWTALVDLTATMGQLRFRFERADYDRGGIDDPDTLEGQILVAQQGRLGTAFNWTNYPGPSDSFELTPEADTLLHRYRGYLKGREPLQPMAYFCLTVLETKYKASKRKRAADALNVHFDVLKAIGELTGETRGDRLSARKAGQGQVPLSSKEQTWLEAAIKFLTLRVGDRQAASRPQITMRDLPPL
jgi:hypothetical protein